MVKTQYSGLAKYSLGGLKRSNSWLCASPLSLCLWCRGTLGTNDWDAEIEKLKRNRRWRYHHHKVSRIGFVIISIFMMKCKSFTIQNYSWFPEQQKKEFCTISLAIENKQMSLWNRKTWARMAQPKAKIVNPPHLISPPPSPSTNPHKSNPPV